LRDDIWIKLMGNAALNPISALSRATMVEICQHPNTRRVVELMMEETLDIAARLGSHPEISIAKRIDGAERVGHHKTSMLQDLEAGKELELDAIVGAVVELADITGAEAPTLRTVYATTHLLSQSARRGSPLAASAVA
jgi:2-dehydropantoate 2-reductase